MLRMEKANNITDARNYLHIKFHYFTQKTQKIRMLQLRWGSQRGSQIGSIKKICSVSHWTDSQN